MTKLFYFSATGNTLKLVRDLANALGDTEIIQISDDINVDQKDCDTVVIAFPVYCFGLPNIVGRFIEKVDFSKDASIYGLASYGGLLASAGKILEKKLNQKGYQVKAGFAIQMPGNATYVYDVAKEEKRNKMFAKEQLSIQAIAQKIKNRESGKIATNLSILGKLISSFSEKMMSKINEGDKNFYADEKCNSCNICEQVCPVNNIQMDEGKPKWLGRCEGCMACFHWCPQKAIQYGEKTKTRGRYHHPDVQIEDFMK